MEKKKVKMVQYSLLQHSKIQSDREITGIYLTHPNQWLLPEKINETQHCVDFSFWNLSTEKTEMSHLKAEGIKALKRLKCHNISTRKASI